MSVYIYIYVCVSVCFYCYIYIYLFIYVFIYWSHPPIHHNPPNPHPVTWSKADCATEISGSSWLKRCRFSASQRSTARIWRPAMASTSQMASPGMRRGASEGRVGRVGIRFIRWTWNSGNLYDLIWFWLTMICYLMLFGWRPKSRSNRM